MLLPILATFFMSSKLVLGACHEGCNEPTLFYATLQCQPIYSSGEDCCPEQFNCSHVQTRSEGKCHFKGNSYNVGDQINNEEIYGNCLVDCNCIEEPSKEKRFSCAVLDCAEWLGLKPQEGCQFRYETNKCCSIEETCPPFDVTCQVGDKVYKEGERFTPPDSKCTECVCQSGFEGSFGPPFCKRTECMEEVTNAYGVKNFCAPSYLSKGDCCPRQWICPDNDSIIAANRFRNLDEPKCIFGDKRLSIGDKFERFHTSNGRKVTCECRIPPYLTCIQDRRYPVYPGNYY